MGEYGRYDTFFTTDAAALWLCRAKGFEPLSLSPLGERNLRDDRHGTTSPAECIQIRDVTPEKRDELV
jgi:hypothetical protein